MNVIEFSCDLCGKIFHELQGGKCVECNKLLCPSCQNKQSDEVICVNCNRLNELEENKHEEENILKSSTDKTELDYDEMKHNDRLKYDEDYLKETKYRKIFENIDTIKLCLKIIFGISIIAASVFIVLHFRYGKDSTIYLYIFGALIYICMMLLAKIHSFLEEYFSVENTEDNIPLNEQLEKLRNKNE